MTASAGPVLKDLHREFGDRVAFVTLFVREAHPGERYPQPDSFEQKLQFAREYRQRDGIPWPVAVDDLEGTLHHALDLKPNSAYLVNADGRVVMRILWSTDARALHEGLEALAAGRRPDRDVRQTKVVPMLRGMGEMYEILGLAGDQARRDILREAPPVYALARLADLFRPLPPLGRGIAATATVALSMVLIGALAWRSLARQR